MEWCSHTLRLSIAGERSEEIRSKLCKKKRQNYYANKGTRLWMPIYVRVYVGLSQPGGAGERLARAPGRRRSPCANGLAC
ncbi:hypothetical protein EVAR_60905_1 [Eumeta japonica]|uniref:Uncharacterized protein n=1 Tax=Eumeta variegata TaxID=151549 RepID=A0A4C1ZIF0_EUMVA|nr:hypothetical protein EVAR_60905_1 [Eumeta japonica]